MAKFPIYDQQTGTTAVSQVSPIAATQSQDIPQGLSQLSSGINQLGSALHGVAVDNANEQIKQQQEKDTAWASNVANQYTLQQIQNFQKYSETSDPSGNGFYDGWNKQQQEGHEKLLASAGTEQQRKLLSHLTDSTNLHFNEKAFTQQTQSSENYKLSNIMSSGKSAAQIAAADPAQANTLIAQYTKVVTESINDPLKAAKLIEQGRNDIINAAYDTEINQNPQGVINKLTNDKSFKTPAAKTIFNTSNAFGVDPVLTSFVIGQESGFNNQAKSKTSSAKGIGQALDSTWKQMMGDKVRTGNIEDETECSVKYIKYLDNRLRSMLGRTPTAAEIRTAYHLGDGGFQKMVNAGSNAKFEEVLPSIIPTNQHLKNQTLASYMQKQDIEFNKHQSQYLSDHPTPFVTYEQRAKILTKAQTAQNQLNEQEKVTLEQLEKNHIAMAANGEMGFKPISFAQLSKVYPKNPEVAKQKYDAYVSAIKVGNQINYMQSMDPSTRAAMISQAAPDPKNPGTYASDAAHQESLIKANEAINKAYQEDPATQALKDPTVRQLSATGGQALQTAMIANQKRMGVINPHLLTKQQEEITIQQLNNTEGIKTAEALNNLKAQYSEEDFKLVAAQLQNNKALASGMTAIIEAPTDLAKQEAALIRFTPLQTLKDALPSNIKLKDVTAALKDALEPYRASLPAAKLDSATYGDITQTIEKITYNQVRLGVKPSVAAQRAVDMFVGKDKSKFIEGAGGNTLRVPAKFNEKQIDYNSRAVVNKLDKNNIDFNGVPLQKNMWYMTDDAEGYLNQIKKNSFWQTNQDDSGASLLFLGSDGRTYPVKDKSGQLITKSFEELSIMPAPSVHHPSADGTSYKLHNQQYSAHQNNAPYPVLKGNK